MAPLDLFALAQDNEAALARRCEELRASLLGDPLARFDLFRAMVERDSGISVNMKPWKLLVFLGIGRYLSIYEIAEKAAAASGLGVEEELLRGQGSHYTRRVLFDRSFEGGERFLYGALNVGGAGASEYGMFCLFLNGEAMRPLRTAFLPDNSLERYVPQAAVLSLREAALREDVATPAHRHTLAALKHADEIASLDAPAWPAMLCAKERFVEAIFVGELKPEGVSELRVDRSEMRRLADLAFDDMMGALASSDRAELDEYNGCMKKLQETGLAARLKEV